MIDTTEAIARVLDDVRDLKTRVTAQEEGQARILHAIVGVQSRIDSMEQWLDRIERIARRVDVADAK
jgi:hypothetical protein